LPASMTRQSWLTVATLSRSDYLEILTNSDLVLAPHRATHWSISTLEAICAGCVPLMNVESFFIEMLEPIIGSLPMSVGKHVRGRWFYFRSELKKRLIDLLDNLDEERQIASLIAKGARAIYDWGTWADAWLDIFHEAERHIPLIGARNPSLLRIMRMIELKSMMPKEAILRELGWSPKQRALSWTSFRKHLRSMAPDDSQRPDAIFRHRPTIKVPEVRCGLSLESRVPIG
jgi:hypothetical protein